MKTFLIKYENKCMVITCKHRDQVTGLVLKALDDSTASRLLDNGWPSKDDINEIPDDEIAAYKP